MPSTYTTSLKLTLPATGELAGTWGTTVNTGITTLVDDAVAGTASITVGGSDYTLTNTDGASNEARKMFITATGTPGAARNVIVPAVSKLYFVFNNTTGGFALTFKTSGGTGVAVAAGARMVLYCDGTNVVNALNAITLASPLPTSSGGTGLSSFTANRVFYSSSTSAIGSSANLTFDGTTLTAAAFSGPLNGTVGATTPASGAFTTLSATGNVSLNGGIFVFNDAGADLDARFEGDTDANLLFLDAGNDRVGIGLNSPASKLHLGNNLTTTNTIPFQIGYASDFYGYRLINTNNPGSTAAGTFSLQRGTTSAWVDVLTSDDNGNVGIGTSPSGAARLSVAGTFRQTDATASNGYTITTATPTTTLATLFGGSSFAIQTGASGTNQLLLDASGNLGIGTASPNAPLQLNKTGVQLGVTTAYLTTRFHETSADVKGVSLGYDSGSQTGIVLGNTATASSNLAFWTFQSGGTGWAERMRITSSGDVGIGTSTPAGKIDAVSNATAAYVARASTTGANQTVNALVAFNADASLYALARYNAVQHIWSYAGTTEGMRLDSSGNLGIGTNSPSAKLHVFGAAKVGTGAASNSHTLMVNNPNGTGTALQLFQDSQESWVMGLPASSTALTWSNSGTERMRITGTGDVGIGTNSPISGAGLTIGNDATGNATVKLAFSTTGTERGSVSMTGGSGELALIAGYSGYGGFMTFQANGAERMRITSAGNISAGAGAVATTATDGFLYVPTCAGTPTGTPTAITGMAPIVVDTTNNKLYFYSGGQWRDAGP